MKILLTTLNAKYVHTSLALWYIYQYCHPEYPELTFREFNINQDLSWVNGEIFLEKAEVVAFSCNIWNIEQIRIIGQRIKALSPQTIIILGGPEVWYEPEQRMVEQSWIDFIVVGEGEIAFKEWLTQYYSKTPDWSQVKGLVFRNKTKVICTTAIQPVIADLGMLPFPYPDDLTSFQHKLVYYESSRGCPYHCQYCLSANEHGVRFFPLEQVKRDLLHFRDAGIIQVKLVDRSFNCHKERARDIWRFLIEHPGKTNYHFEIVGDLLDDETLAVLQAAPLGLFQFEIGVQSTNPQTLQRIQRDMNFERLSTQVKKLLSFGNIHVHLDLIAGLPEEDYDSFAKSFNDNMALEPDRLQLGFLKLLNGSGLRQKVEENEYLYTMEAPYEVMSSRWVQYHEMLMLKTIEDLLERYYNSGRYKKSLPYLFSQFSSTFTFFESLAVWWKQKKYDEIAHKSKDLYGYLVNFGVEWGANRIILRNLLKYDLLSCERLVELPEWTGPINMNVRTKSYAFWQEAAHRERYIPEFSDLTVREIQRRVILEEFEINPDLVSPERQLLLFVYGTTKTKVIQIENKEFFQ